MKPYKKLRILPAAMPFLMMVLLFSQCKKEKDNSELSSSSKDATIMGRIHTPSGIALGSVEVKAGANATKSDKNGDFILKVVPGNYTLVMQTGAGHVFKTEMNITVGVSQTVLLTPAESVLKQIKNLAYIPGTWDQIQTIIIDTLGYSATAITMNDLSNLSTLTPFAALFLNCGVLEMSGVSMDSTKYANLNSYLSNLGSIYASDFAVECLTGDNHLRPYGSGNNLGRIGHTAESGIHTLASCVSPKIGGFIEDSSLCTLKSGAAGMVANAHINDPSIVNLLGKDSIDIFYDLGGWEVVNLVDAPFNPIITDNNMGYGPLAVSMDVDAENAGGVIYFTTFHNHPSGFYSHDVQHILQYFILNL